MIFNARIIFFPRHSAQSTARIISIEYVINTSKNTVSFTSGEISVYFHR